MKFAWYYVAVFYSIIGLPVSLYGMDKASKASLVKSKPKKRHSLKLHNGASHKILIRYRFTGKNIAVLSLVPDQYITMPYFHLEEFQVASYGVYLGWFNANKVIAGWLGKPDMAKCVNEAFEEGFFESYHRLLDTELAWRFLGNGYFRAAVGYILPYSHTITQCDSRKDQDYTPDECVLYIFPQVSYVRKLDPPSLVQPRYLLSLPLGASAEEARCAYDILKIYWEEDACMYKEDIPPIMLALLKAAFDAFTSGGREQFDQLVAIYLEKKRAERKIEIEK